LYEEEEAERSGGKETGIRIKIRIKMCHPREIAGTRINPNPRLKRP
jgi:hypothetical protein